MDGDARPRLERRGAASRAETSGTSRRMRPRFSEGFRAGHAELGGLRVQAPAAPAADADFGRGRLPPLPVEGPVLRDGVRQEDEPPKAEEPSPDSREDAASDEEADRAEEPLEERADGELAARRVPHRSRDEAEHSPQDHRDAQDGEAGPRDQGGRRAPAQGEAP